MTAFIGRRELITLLGAAALPLAARPAAGVPVIGFIRPGRPMPWRAMWPRSASLSETGYVEGQNVTVEYHRMEGQYHREPGVIAELIRRRGRHRHPGTPIAALALKPRRRRSRSSWHRQDPLNWI